MDTHLHAVAMPVSLGLEHQHHKGFWAASSASAVETGLRSFGSLVRRLLAPFPEPLAYSVLTMLSAEEARGYSARFDVVAGRGRALAALLSSWWTPTRRSGYDRGLGLLGALAFVPRAPQGPRLEPGRGAHVRGGR